ncbi:unnamed protein product, partial [Adineta steineri]
LARQEEEIQQRQKDIDEKQAALDKAEEERSISEAQVAEEAKQIGVGVGLVVIEC